jgi:hypothetical protein
LSDERRRAPSPADLPPLLSVPEACRRLAVPPIGRNAGYELVRTGAWRSVRIGARLLVVTASVLAWIDRVATEGSESGPVRSDGGKSPWRPIGEALGSDDRMSTREARLAEVSRDPPYERGRAASGEPRGRPRPRRPAERPPG